MKEALPSPPAFKAAMLRLAVASVLVAGLMLLTVMYSAGVFRRSAKPTAGQQAVGQNHLPSKAADPQQAAGSLRQASGRNEPSVTPRQTSETQQRQAGDSPAGLVSGGAAAPVPTRAVLTRREELTGSRFTFNPLDIHQPPVVTFVDLPVTSQGYAIWGSVGTDTQGRIWTGVSTDGRGGSSAQLVSYDPKTSTATSQGLVLEQLDQHSLGHPDMGQAKIHSRIIQGADGYLYFSSMDEQGEASDGSRDPRWGGWLWRLRPGEKTWQPLFHADKALMAVAGYGTDIYALGYHGHVLYHFDTNTGKHRQIEVGSIAGHVSRNFIVDRLGQAYVPKVTRGLLEDDPPRVWLVQYDRELRPVASTPLLHYLAGRPSDSHGIISFVHMRDGSIIFATHHGYLYRIQPVTTEGVFNPVQPLGYFHPQGGRYTPTMHTYDGQRYIVGVVKKQPVQDKPQGQATFEWVVFDVESRTSKAVDLDIRLPGVASTRNLLLYGSMTRDAQGDFYVVGTHLNQRRPLLVKLSPQMN